ncbi:MAG: hypothetical protein IH608_00420 [Proteobacteria bacterium]|nr:hypothetical protein [Pseudomonadota bacterium]
MPPIGRRRFLCGLAGLVLGLVAGASSGPAAASEGWTAHASDHFQVFRRGDGDPVFAAQVSRAAERLYSWIQVDLGLDRVVKRHHLALWLWEGRCSIYLHRDRHEYLQATGAPLWSGGFVRYRERVIHSYADADSFLSSTLPHELAHILFREFVGYDNPVVPRWLDEGVAQYVEHRDSGTEWSEVREMAARGRYLPFASLNRLHPGPDGSSARIFYGQAASLVHFLIQEYGAGRFVDFCSNLRDGYPVERALSFATGGSLGSMEELEAVWRRFYR